MLPFVSCLCPTYRRPQLLANAMACFLQQDYPPERCELVVLDDAGQIQPLQGPRIRIHSETQRIPSITEKYNALAQLALGDIFVVWEDDDIYLKHHIFAHVNALRNGAVSKPSQVLSLYPGHLVREDSAGRFHASLAFTREAYDRVGGWPRTKRADFDQQLIQNLIRMGGRLVDPTHDFPPSYIFRFGSTQMPHGQSYMQGNDDTTWYEKCGTLRQLCWDESVVAAPMMDDETRRMYSQCPFVRYVL